MLHVLVGQAQVLKQLEIRQHLALAVERCQVADAQDYGALRRHLRQARWDVVLVDLMLPGMHGLGVFDELMRDYPRVPFLLLGEAADPSTATCCLRAGAAGYLDWSRLGMELTTALRTLLAGGVYISHDLVLWPNPFVTRN
jgi:DNA-binding NarL/FixJ family response regulator